MNKNTYFGSPSGFTLIELLIVITMMAIISSIGISSFISYSKNQVFQQDLANFVNTLNIAKANTYSQVNYNGSGACNSQPLKAYEVVIDNGGAGYGLWVMCQAGSNQLSHKSFSSSVLNPGSKQIIFQLLTGGVLGAGDITFSENGSTKTVNVSQVGVISVR